MLVKLEWLGYRVVQKKLWRYVKPFSSDTGTLRTDRRTDLLYRASVCWRAIKTEIWGQWIGLRSVNSKNSKHLCYADHNHIFHGIATVNKCLGSFRMWGFRVRPSWRARRNDRRGNYRHRPSSYWRWLNTAPVWRRGGWTSPVPNHRWPQMDQHSV